MQFLTGSMISVVICVAAFVTAPHKLPSAYMTFLLRHSGVYIRLLYALMHVVNNEQMHSC